MKEAIAFARLTKIDEEQRLVYGRAVQEVLDRTGEVFDYDSSKPLFVKWSESQLKASAGKSAGNVRAMHGNIAAGILVPGTGLVFHDDERAIDVCTKVTDDNEWKKVLSGTYTGYSIGGEYAKKWKADGVTRYTGDPVEISFVDRPAGPTCTFYEIRKADGSVEAKPFKQPREAMVKYLVDHGGKADILAKAPDDDLSERYLEAITAARLEELRKGASQPLELVRADGQAFAAKATVTDNGVKVDDEIEVEGQLWRITKIEAGKATVELAKAQTDDVEAEVEGTPEEVTAFSVLLADNGLTIGDAAALVKRGLPNAEPTALEIEVVAKALAEADGKNPDEELAIEGTKVPVWKGYAQRAAAEVRKVKAREDVQGIVRAPARKFADAKNRKYPIDTPHQVKAAWAYVHQPVCAKLYGDEDLKALKAVIAEAWKEKVDKAGPPAIDSVEFKKSADEATAVLVKGLRKRLGLKDDQVPEDGLKVSAGLRKGLYHCGAFCQLIDSLCSLADSCEWEAFQEGDGSALAGEIRSAVKVLGAVLEKMVAEEVGEALGDDADLMATAQRVGELVKRLAAIKDAPAGAGAAPAAGSQGAEFTKALEPLTAKLTEALAKIAKLEAEPRAPKGRLLVLDKAQDITTSPGALDAPKPILKSDGSVDLEKTALEMTKWAQAHPIQLVNSKG